MGKRTIVDIPATPHFDFVFGFYHLSTWRIPYFATTISLRHAAQNLRLTVEFPGAETIEWRLDELYQRDVDWPRVERKIVPYLHAQDQPQFFNSLTVALVPMREGGEIGESFSQFSDWTPPKMDERLAFAKVHAVGPIVCGYWEDWQNITDPEASTGKIRWNPSDVFAVALDGQHRLAAIKQFVDSPGVDESRLDETRVPTILLILDEKLGYEVPPSRSLIEVLRTLFIDLNKHAKIVSRARQILLDDKDPTSVCVRALVGDRLSDGIEELKATPPCIPLSLVDWHTEQAKFDEGPYLTTTLGLDWVISSLLGAKPISDYTDYGGVRRQLRALQRSLKLDLQAAEERLEELREIELRPFYYGDNTENDELGEIAATFQRVWNPAITTLLMGLHPYRELLQLREEEGTYTLDFINWYVLKHRADRDKYAGRATDEYKRLLGRLQSRTKDPIGEGHLKDSLGRIESFKRDNLAFNVVFQRAYFLAFNEFQKVKPEHVEELEDEIAVGVPDLDDEEEEEEEEEAVAQDEDNGFDGYEEDDDSEDAEIGSDVAIEYHGAQLLERSKQFVQAMNALIDAEPGVLKVDFRFDHEDGDAERFWLGTLQKPEGGIDFTMGASKRASEVLFWVAAMQLYDEVVEPKSASDFDEFWVAVRAKETGLMRRVAGSVRRFSSKETSAGGRILKTKEEEFSKEASEEEARKRLEWLWNTLGL